jgi:hypothetical protein
VFKDVPRGEVYVYVNGKALIEPRPLLEAFRAIRSLTRTVSSYREPSRPQPTGQSHRMEAVPLHSKAAAVTV